MEHAELIKELSHIEKLTNQERLKLAHSRRKLQLKTWNQHEKILNTLNNNNNAHSKKTFKNSQQQKIIEEERQREAEKRARAIKNKNRRIRFKNSIMLLEAAGRNDVVEVRRLLEEGVDPDVANEDGLTALHQCCIDDNEDMMKLLVESGANVNAEDSEKWTPLHAAATCGHLHLVKYLIAKGANLLAVNAEGNMPYDICDEEHTLDYIESEMAKRGVTQELIEEIRALPETRMLQDMQRILAQGGDLEFRDKDGATYLHIAAANGYLQVVEFLLDNHVATDVQDKDCWQPIHAAACWGHVDVLELLVQNGADLNARTKNNETPYAICEDLEIKERIMQLRSEQETKLRQGGVSKIRRSVSSNSRTQSIRRTSQRDKGLTSKKDAADEAAMLLTINLNQDNNSPSPTGDMAQVELGSSNRPSTDTTDSVAQLVPNSPNPIEPEHDHQSSLTSEEDIDIKNLPPHIIYGRDSITQLHLDASPLRKLRSTSSVESNGHGHGDPIISPSSPTKNFNNNISNHSNGKKKVSSSSHTNKSTAPRPHPVPPVQTVSNNSLSADTNANLPKPDITSSVGVGPKLSNNMISPTSGGRVNGNGISTSINPILQPEPKSKMDDLLEQNPNPNNTIDIRVQVTINTNNGPQNGINSNGTMTTASATGPLHPQINHNNNHNAHGQILGSILTSSHLNMNHLAYNSTPAGTLADLKKQRSLHYNSIGRNSNFISLNGILDPPPKYEPPPSPSMSLQKFSGNASEPVGEYTENPKKCCRIV